MITIAVLGLDQYVVGHYSKEHTENLANLLEVEEDEINFYAPQSVIFHRGVEQTSWNTLIIVSLPERLAVLEEKVATYLLNTFTNFTINLEIEFQYFHEGHRYQKINSDFPRFIQEEQLEKEANLLREAEEEAHKDADLLDDEDDEDEIDINNPEELYLGNVFAGHEEELEAKAEKDLAMLRKKRK